MQKITNILSSNNSMEPSESVNKTICVGFIVGITENRQAIVNYPGRSDGQGIARSILDAGLSNPSELVGQNVLLAFENGDTSLPIIIGFVHDELYKTMNEVVNFEDINPKEVISDGERLVLEAKAEVVLKCGQGSITLRSDGKVIVKGTQIVSRASGSNKVKGATVKIN